MTSPKKSEILKILDEEIAARKAQLTKAESSRKERVEETIASWSAAGDRAHAENALDLARSALAQVEALREEVFNSNDLAPEKTAPVSFVTLQDDSTGTTKNFYLASESIKLPEVTVLGTKSPLGQAILGKSVGDKYSYKIDGTEYSGKIVSIE
jgi:transcription elongation GreA/GreB family factor